MEVFDRIVDQIHSVRGMEFELKDFEHEINTTVMTHVLQGKVKFHSGIVNRIEKFELNELKYKHVWLNEYVRKRVYKIILD